MQIAEHEEKGDEDDGLDHGDEDEIIGQMTMVLLDGKKQDSNEEDGQDQGHHDVFGKFAHNFYHKLAYLRFIILGNFFGSKISELWNTEIPSCRKLYSIIR